MSDGLNREGFTEPQPAMTPGQAACVAWNERFGEQFGVIAAEEWALGDPRGRVAWEAAAIAGHNAFAAQPQPAPDCPDPGTHVTVRDFLTGRELSHQETTDAPQPAPELTAAIQDVIDRYPEREPAPELAAAMAAGDDLYRPELVRLRDRLATLAASLDADALATQPSKKSQIQADAARRIREALA